MPDLIGSSLGPYRILEQIGLGGMATVYKAYQPGTDRLVALKVLPAHFARDARFVKRFEQEARVIAKLEHRNIVPIYGFGNDNGTVYLIMRYLQAGTIKDILRRGPLPLRDCAHLLNDVASALDYAHAQGIIHRDVKPSNILVDKQGNSYLADFGIAKVVESTLEMTGSAALGTPAYMAPEQTLGKAATPLSDVYSLGVMLYEMVTGKPPFEADTPMAVALMHVHEPLPLPRKFRPDLPEAVQLVIQKALAKNPPERFQSAGAFARAFADSLGTQANSEASRLAELASAAAANLGSEDVTYDIRAELDRQQNKERLRRVSRWIPATIILSAICVLGVAALWPGVLVKNTQAQALQTGTAMANVPLVSTPTFSTSVPASSTPRPTPTLDATQTAYAVTVAVVSTQNAILLTEANSTAEALQAEAILTHWVAIETQVAATIAAGPPTATQPPAPVQDNSWIYNSNQINHVVFNTTGCTYIKIRPGPVVFHVIIELWDSEQAARSGAAANWPLVQISGWGSSFNRVARGPTQNQATGKWGFDYISEAYENSNLQVGTYQFTASGPGVNSSCTVVVQN